MFPLFCSTFSPGISDLDCSMFSPGISDLDWSMFSTGDSGFACSTFSISRVFDLSSSLSSEGRCPTAPKSPPSGRESFKVSEECDKKSDKRVKDAMRGNSSGEFTSCDVCEMT
uniref:Uncharacterized protein n=1 Tax=Clytia hemisphaerica TaxID=252671 RepID=A0A7M5UU09_9CNID